MIRRSLFTVALGALAVAACQPGVGAGMGGAEGRGAFEGPAPTHASAGDLAQNNPSINWNDSCTTSMGAIVESLLDYYAAHRQLPPSLQQLPEKSLSGEKLQFVCPVSGRPYQYFAQGFQLAREYLPANLADNPKFVPPTLILFDAQPAHEISRRFINNGSEYELKAKVRYGIVMDPPRPNSPVKMYIVPLDQALLDFYLKSSQRVQVRPIGEGP